MAPEIPKSSDRRAGASRGYVLPLLVVLVVAMALAAAWHWRATLAQRTVLAYLGRLGVPARVHVSRLDPRVVEGAVAFGPPANPTLVVPRFSARLGGWSASGPVVESVELWSPRLNLRFDGKSLDLGALQRLVDELRRRPSNQPAPSIAVHDGQVALATPYGVARARVDAQTDQRRLVSAEMSLDPTDLRGGTMVMTRLQGQGRIAVTPDGRYQIHIGLSAPRASNNGLRLQGVSARIDAVGPATLDGPVDGTFALNAAQARLGGLSADGVAATGHIEGRINHASTSLVAAVDASASRLGAGTVKAETVKLSVSAPVLKTSQGEMAAPGLVFALVAPAARISLPGATPILSLQARGKTDIAWSKDRGFAAKGALSSSGHERLPPDEARRLAARIAPGDAARDLRDALARNLAGVSVDAPAIAFRIDGKAGDATLARRVSARGDGGAAIQLDGPRLHWSSRGVALSGPARLVASGGGLPALTVAASRLEATRGSISGQFTASARYSGGPFEDARAAASMTLRTTGRGMRLALLECAPLALAAYRADTRAPVVSDLSAKICPADGAPLLESGPQGRWSLAGRVADGSVLADGAGVKLANAGADIRLAGGPGAPAGAVDLERATVSDTQKPIRFRPLRLSGRLQMKDSTLDGRLKLALAAHDLELGSATVHYDQRRQAGSLTVSAPRLAFAPGGLQPASILPALSAAGRDVQGPVALDMTVTLRDGRAESRIQASTPGLQLRTPAGLMSGLRGNLLFTGVAPHLTAVDQEIDADRLEAVVPLTDLRVRFSADDRALALKSASAALSGGRVSLDPMTIAFDQTATAKGVARAEEVELGPIVQALNLSNALTIEARLSGSLPFRFGPEGLRIAGGELAATGPGRLTLHRGAISSATASTAAGAPAPNAAQDLAFQALENLAFTALDARVDSRPQGRLGVVFHIKGRHDPPRDRPARISLFDLLRGRAFDKPIPLPKGTQIDLTLDSSLNLDELLGAGAKKGGEPGSPTVQLKPGIPK